MNHASVVTLFGAVMAARRVRQRCRLGRIRRHACGAVTQLPQQQSVLASVQSLSNPAQIVQLSRQLSGICEEIDRFGQEVSESFESTGRQASKDTVWLSERFDQLGRQVSRQLTDSFDPLGMAMGSQAVRTTEYSWLYSQQQGMFNPSEVVKIAADIVNDAYTDVLTENMGPMEVLADVFKDVVVDVYTCN
jgi:hypothetical protein